MSKRKWRSKAVVVVSSDDEEQEIAAVLPPAAAIPPQASRRSALPLSQSTAGASNASGSSALAVLLAGSKALRNNAAPPAKGRPPAPKRGARRPPAATSAAATSGLTASAGQVGAGEAEAAAVTGTARPKAAGPGATAARAAAGAGTAAQGQLWVVKYGPRSEEELIVHKKKVQEVKEWLEEQRATLGRPAGSRLLVVSGPPGCGKSTVLTTLAASLGCQVSEWRPPGVVGWDEAQHAGMQRRTKLDEFNEFVARTRLPHLSLSSSTSGSGSLKPAGIINGSGTDRLKAAGIAGPAGSSSSATAAAGSQPSTAAAEAASARGQSLGPGGTAVPPRPGRLPPSLLPTLVIVDDLPHASGPEQRRQIAEALRDLAAGARFPVVVVATETSGKAQQEKGLSAAAGSYQGLHKDIIAVLESQGATTISFNPITTLNTVKALRGVLERERRSLPEADVMAIAEQANGDLHNAISTLQFVCTGTSALAAAPAGKQRGRGTKRKVAAATAGGGKEGGCAGEAATAQQRGSQVGFALRDSSLSLFHALGKLLYNKRLPAQTSQRPNSGNLSGASFAATQQHQQQQHSQRQQAASSQASSLQPWTAQSSTQLYTGHPGTQPWTAHAFWQSAVANAAEPVAGLPVAPWAQRQPMEFDPEAVLAAAGLEAGSVAAFLHENLLHFIGEEAIADAAGCLEALSACDAMASGRRWGTDDAIMDDADVASATLLDAAAASVAARGVCFHNSHPAPRRFLSLKAPALYLAAKGAGANSLELSRSTTAAWAVQGGMGCLHSSGLLAAELLPYARAIAPGHPHGSPIHRLQPARWSRFWNGQLYESQGRDRPGAGSAAGAGGGTGGGWQLGDWDEGFEGGGDGQQAQQLAEDEIEESEEDW